MKNLGPDSQYDFSEFRFLSSSSDRALISSALYPPKTQVNLPGTVLNGTLKCNNNKKLTKVESSLLFTRSEVGSLTCIGYDSPTHGTVGCKSPPKDLAMRIKCLAKGHNCHGWA